MPRDGMTKRTNTHADYHQKRSLHRLRDPCEHLPGGVHGVGLYMRPVFEVGEHERYKDLIRKTIEDCPARAITVDTGERKADGTKG